LSKIATEAAAEHRREELREVFGKFGGPEGVVPIVQVNSTFAFVEFASARQADLAMFDLEMQVKYRMSKAKKSKYDTQDEEYFHR